VQWETILQGEAPAKPGLVLGAAMDPSKARPRTGRAREISDFHKPFGTNGFPPAMPRSVESSL
jgi:hypothetical protein